MFGELFFYTKKTFMNKKTRTNPPIIHSPGMANLNYKETNSCWEMFKNISKKANSRSPRETKIVLCNNLATTEAEKCLSNLGVSFIVLGKEIENWNNLLKVELILNNLNEIYEDNIMYLDSTDVCIIGDIYNSIEVLEKNNCDMLFNAEKQFYPSCPSLDSIENFEIKMSDTCYFALNAGCWIAKKEYLRRILPELLEINVDKYLLESYGHIEPFRISESDQFRWHILYKKHHPRIKVDKNCELFQNVFLHKHNDFILKVF